MSYGGNNSNSGRSSIFETFHSPNFGDETFEVQPLSQPLKISSRPSQPETTNTLTQKRSLDSLLSVQQQSTGGQQEQEVEDYVMDDDDEEDDASSSDNAQTTLWMSCSPGRDLTDDEADEEWGESTSQEMNEERGFGEDGGKSSDEENNEDEDDGLPLSKLAGKQFVDQGLIHSNVKRVKSIKLKKAGKDKIGPKKEIALNSKKKMKMKLKKRSAYSFFYHDTQNAIKSQNPAATFGEISKIVASMWDHLEGGLKEDYSRRAEEYNTQHKDQVLLSAKLKSKKPKKSSSSSTKSKHKLLDTEIKSESLDSVDSSAFKVKLELKEVKDESGDSVDGNSISFSGSGRSKMPKEEKQEKDSKPKPLCNYTKCQNPAVDDPRWEFNYCSPQCVISHCKDVFKAWVANRKSAYCET